MAWVALIVAGFLEVGFATSLKLSESFSRLWPSLAFLAFGAASFGVLSYSLRTLPVGTAYAVWTGIGAAGTAALGIAAFGDPATALRLGAIALIIGGVVLLNVSGAHG